MALICEQFNNLKKSLKTGGFTFENMSILASKINYNKTSYKLDYFMYKFTKQELFEFFLAGDMSINMSNSKADFVRRIKLNLINGGFVNYE
jgi:hypothetical protein